MVDTKLIVLRGPSGSGKTTTAKELFDGAKQRTVLIEQDYYRFIFNPPGGGEKPNSDAIHEMIRNDVLIALDHGYHVILEGILSVQAYAKVLDDIFEQHPDNNYMFYFDISFEETVRRHKKRQTSPPKSIDDKLLVQDVKRFERLQDFDESDMRQWYDGSHRSNHKLEQIIPESFTLKDSLEFIRKKTGF